MSDIHTRLAELSIILNELPEDIRVDTNVTFGFDNEVHIWCYTTDAREARTAFRETGIRRRWAKRYDDYSAYFECVTASGIEVTIQVSRTSVCKQVEVGVETVQVPDYTSVPRKSVTRPVYEWKC